MRIIIFGLGNSRLNVEKYLRKTHEIVGYTDSYADIDCFGTARYIPLGSLKDEEFDYIVISVEKVATSAGIEKMLIDTYQVPAEKVICFYRDFVPCQKVDRVLLPVTDKKYNGIVLGISHAEKGIRGELLHGNFINLAVGSQDIYYNYKTLQISLDRYYDRFALDTIIFDMYDYNYFNYDISRLPSAMSYFGWGGGM